MANDYGGGAPAPSNRINERPRYRTRNITATKPRKRRVIKDRPTPKRNRPRIGDRPRQRQVDPFAREVNALADLMFGPQERQLAERKAQEQQFGVNANSWYAKHIQDMQKAQAFTAGVNQGFQQAAYGAAQNAATTDQTANNQGLQQAQAQAAKFGTQVDTSVYQQANQAASARQQMGNAGGNLLASQGMAQNQFLNSQIQAGSEQGIQAQQDSQERQRALSTVAQDLAREKGAAKVKTKMELQEMYWKRRLEEAVFGLDRMETLAGIADDQADNALARQKEKRDARQDRARLKLDRYKAKSGTWQQRHQAKLDRAADIADDGKRNYSKTYTSGDTPAGGAKGNGKNGRGVKGDVDGDGIADRGKYRGYSESERDRFDAAARLLRRKGVNKKNAQQALDALIFEEHIPRRIASRALRAHLRRLRKRAQPPAGDRSPGQRGPGASPN